jgi:hypothetical protein
VKDTSGQFRLTGSSTNATKDASKVAGDVVLQGAIASASTVLLAVAAGEATVPIVGWIGAAVTVAIAALCTAVEAVLTAKIKRKEAILWAAQLGLPNAEDFPKFVVDLAHMGFTQRYALGADLTRQIAAERDPEKRKVLDTQRKIVGILLVREWLAAHPSVVKRLATPANPDPVVPPPIASRAVLAATYSPWTPWLVSGTLLAAAAIAAFA